MKKIYFTLQDAPDFIKSLDADLQVNSNGDYTIGEETAFAYLINRRFPELQKTNRRIKNLIVIDEEGNKYSTEDFDILGSTTKRDK